MKKYSTLGRSFALSVLALTAALGGGCKSVRTQVGVGLGLGATVKVPALIHVGAQVGQFKHYGLEYDGVIHNEDEFEFTCLGGLYHVEHQGDANDQYKHVCLGLSPLFSLLSGEEGSPEHKDGWALEVSFALIWFDVRLGFNPALLFGDDEDKDTRGGGEPVPTTEATEARTAPDGANLDPS